VIGDALSRPLTSVALSFDYAASKEHISVLKQVVGHSGWLEMSNLTVESLEQQEILLFTAITDDGSTVSEDLGQKLFALPATAESSDIGPLPDSALSSQRDLNVQRRLEQLEARSAKCFGAEVGKLDLWSDHLKLGLERELKDIGKEIREVREQSAVAVALKDKLQAQRRMKDLETSRNKRGGENYSRLRTRLTSRGMFSSATLRSS
jgi:hypothetical protein